MTDHLIDEETRQRMEDELRAQGINAPGARFSAADAVDQGILTMPISFGISQGARDSMTDRIEPALSAEDFEDIERYGVPDHCERFAWSGEWPKVIALANAALPDDDARKITRETVRAILAARATYPLGSASHRELIQIAAALASYLPSDQQPAELVSAYAAYLPPEGP